MGSVMVMLPVPVYELAATVGELLMVTSKLLGAVTVTLPELSHFCKSKALTFDLFNKLNVPEFKRVLSAVSAPLPLSAKVPELMVVEPV